MIILFPLQTGYVDYPVDKSLLRSARLVSDEARASSTPPPSTTTSQPGTAMTPWPTATAMHDTIEPDCFNDPQDYTISSRSQSSTPRSPSCSTTSAPPRPWCDDQGGAGHLRHFCLPRPPQLPARHPIHLLGACLRSSWQPIIIGEKEVTSREIKILSSFPCSG